MEEVPFEIADAVQAWTQRPQQEGWEEAYWGHVGLGSLQRSLQLQTDFCGLVISYLKD